MESPGEYLKREREIRGISLMKIFEATRVPLKYLEALEADRYEDMPHSAFIKGFIKSYCKVLGLDETDAVLRYEIFIKDRAAEEEEKAGVKPAAVPRIKKQPQKPVEKKRVRFILPAAIIAGIVILIFAYAMLRRAPLKVQQPVAQPAPALQQQAPAAQTASPAPQAVSSSPAPPAQQIPAQAPAAKPAEPAQAAAAPQKAAEPVKTQTPKAVQGAPVPAAAPAQPSEKAKQPEPVKNDAAPKPDAAKDKESGLAQKTHTLTANAREDVWMKVGIDGEEPTEVLLREGQRFTWKASGNFSVRVGNAGGVTLSYNGRELPSLGGPGQVVSLNLPVAQKPVAKSQAPAGPAN